MGCYTLTQPSPLLPPFGSLLFLFSFSSSPSLPLLPYSFNSIFFSIFFKTQANLRKISTVKTYIFHFHFSFLFISFFSLLFFSFPPFSHHHHLTGVGKSSGGHCRRSFVSGEPSIFLFISHSLHFPFFFYSLSIIFLSFSHHSNTFFLTFFNINYILSLKKMCNFLPKIISTF